MLRPHFTSLRCSQLLRLHRVKMCANVNCQVSDTDVARWGRVGRPLPDYVDPARVGTLPSSHNRHRDKCCLQCSTRSLRFQSRLGGEYRLWPQEYLKKGTLSCLYIYVFFLYFISSTCQNVVVFFLFCFLLIFLSLLYSRIRHCNDRDSG